MLPHTVVLVEHCATPGGTMEPMEPLSAQKTIELFGSSAGLKTILFFQGED